MGIPFWPYLSGHIVVVRRVLINSRHGTNQGGRPWLFKTVFFLDSKDTARSDSDIAGVACSCGVSLSLSSFDMRRPSMVMGCLSLEEPVNYELPEARRFINFRKMQGPALDLRSC
jgi:hypothetical protein